VSTSQFAFLEPEFADQCELAQRAERYAIPDPGASVIYARKTLESAVKWMYSFDRALPRPYEDQLNAYLNEPAFKSLADGRVFNVAKKIQRAGNRAVHESKAPTKLEAIEVLSALFQFCFWFAFTYGREHKPDPAIKFVPEQLTAARLADEAVTLKQRQELEEELERRAIEVEAAREQAALLAKSNAELEAEAATLRAEIAAAKKVAEALRVEAHDWSEFETRRFKIDALLAEAGWLLRDERDREFEVTGMPSGSGVGYVDYVLWGDDGLPLALVEAKKTLVSPATGQQQAKLYADCLERMTGQRPIIFATNGFEHWLWDDTQAPPRPVQGFLT
jgi:type I restriction enzyme R subunit